MRDCPTPKSSSMPLIVHHIAADECMSRQSCHYHKCHRCIYRDQAADWQPEAVAAAPQAGPTRAAERSIPSKIVEIPRPEKAPAKQVSAAPKAAPASRKTSKQAPAGRNAADAAN